MSSDVVRIGALSTASINERVFAATRDLSTVKWVAVASREPERAEAYATKHGLPHWFDSYQELIQSDVVDALYLSGVNSDHAKLAELCAQHGKHALVEKPWALDPAAVQRSIAAAVASDVVIGEALIYRHHPQTTLLLDLTQAGTLGAIRHIGAEMSFRLRRRGDPRLSPELDGGSVADLGPYPVGMSRLLVGEPSKVSAVMHNDGQRVDMRCTGHLFSEDDVITQFAVSMNQPRRDRLVIVGTERIAVSHDPWHGRLDTIELYAPNEDGDQPPPLDGLEVVKIDPHDQHGLTGSILDAYRLEFRAFTDAILQRGPHTWDANDAVRQARVLQALYAAARTGQTENV